MKKFNIVTVAMNGCFHLEITGEGYVSGLCEYTLHLGDLYGTCQTVKLVNPEKETGLDGSVFVLVKGEFRFYTDIPTDPKTTQQDIESSVKWAVKEQKERSHLYRGRQYVERWESARACHLPSSL